MKPIYLSFLALILLGCQKEATVYSNNYYSLAVPSAYTLDSAYFSKYEENGFNRMRQLDATPDVYTYSIIKKTDDKSKSISGIQFYNLQVINDSNKTAQELLTDKMTELMGMFKKEGETKYELLVPLKDSTMNGNTFFYSTYDLEVKNREEKQPEKYFRKHSIIYIKNKSTVYMFAVMGSYKGDWNKEFSELFGILGTLKFKS